MKLKSSYLLVGMFVLVFILHGLILLSEYSRPKEEVEAGAPLTLIWGISLEIWTIFFSVVLAVFGKCLSSAKMHDKWHFWISAMFQPLWDRSLRSWALWIVDIGGALLWFGTCWSIVQLMGKYLLDRQVDIAPALLFILGGLAIFGVGLLLVPKKGSEVQSISTRSRG